jgi:hypothetical protein
MALKPYPRVRIVSDGTGKGTHVYDAEGNEVLKGEISGITWEMNREGHFLGRVKLELVGAKLEAEGALVEVEVPVMKTVPPGLSGDALKRWLEERGKRIMPEVPA